MKNGSLIDLVVVVVFNFSTHNLINSYSTNKRNEVIFH